MTKKFDAIIVGGGMTGGYAAKNLCEAGLKVLLLERGPEKSHPEGYTNVEKDPWDFENRGILTAKEKEQNPVQAHNHFYTAATSDQFVDDIKNPYSTPEDKPFSWFRSYQLGGKSLLWARQTYRWSDQDFKANALDGTAIAWPIGYEDLRPYYDEVEAFMGVSGNQDGLSQLPDGDFLPPMEMNDMEVYAQNKLLEAWPDRNLIMGRVANLTQAHNGREACIYRNRCTNGCPGGSYYSTLSGPLPIAQDTGNLTIRCDSIVDQIHYDKEAGRAKSVSGIDTNTMEKFEFEASLIFVCAGTLSSTWLLLNSERRSGIGNESGQLGHNLMDHHNCIVSAHFSGGPDTFPQGRRPTTCYLPRFRNLDDSSQLGFKRGYGFAVEITREDWRRAYYSEDIGSDLKENMTKWGVWRVTFIGYGETLPVHTNKVELDHDKLDHWGLPTLRVSANFNENENLMNKDMIETATEMLAEFSDATPQTWRQMSVPGEAIHEMGTARMGSSRSSSVLDPFSRMWEAPNVYVTDGSGMVSSACQNPSLTYMALTARACEAAVKDLGIVP